MDKVTAEEYQQTQDDMNSFLVTKKVLLHALTEIFNNGWDMIKTKKFIRFTKSVFKQLIAQKRNEKR